MTRLARALSNVSKLTLLFIAASLLTVAGLLHFKPAGALRIDPRSIKIDNSSAGAASVTYEVTLGVTTPGTLGSVKIEFCSNTSIIDDPVCDAPAGLDTLDAALASQTGETGFSITSQPNANEIFLSRTPSSAAVGSSVYTFTHVANPADEGTMYVRIFTYPTSDLSGPFTDAGGLALAFNKLVNISAEVPPFLIFCAGEVISGFNCATTEGDFIDFGTFGADHTAAGTSQMVTGTNADGGYTVRVNGSGLASGTNVIAPMSGGPSVRGASQFGLNLRANVSPLVGQDPSGPGAGQPKPGYDTPDQYRFSSGDVIASSTDVDDFRKFTVSYIVNVPSDQPGGIYATTMTYICLANF